MNAYNPYNINPATTSSMEFPGAMNTNFQSPQANGFFGQYSVQAPYTATQPMATNATATYPAIAFQPMGAPIMTNQPQVVPMYNGYSSAVPPMGFSIYDTQPIHTPVNPYSYTSFSYPQPFAPAYIEQTPENNPFLTPSAPPMEITYEQIVQNEPVVDHDLEKLEKELQEAQAILATTQLELNDIDQKIRQSEATVGTLKNKEKLNTEREYIMQISKLYASKEEVSRHYNKILDMVNIRQANLISYNQK